MKMSQHSAIRRTSAAIRFLLTLSPIWLFGCQAERPPSRLGAADQQACSPQPASERVDKPIGVQRLAFDAGGRRLTVEVLADSLIHFELADANAVTAPSALLPTTPMVFQTGYNGPTRFRRASADSFETRDLRLAIDAASLHATATDIRQTPSVTLTSIRPVSLADDATVLTIDRGSAQAVYGLGEQFESPGRSDGDWIGRVRSPGNEFGNALVDFEDRASCIGNAMFPVMYALGDAGRDYALFVDHIYGQRWDFTAEPWRLETRGDPIRWYLMTGPSPEALHKQYMDLTGRPPVPPKKAFGLWVSEYGFDDWKELEDHWTTLRANGFPVDGFVLDLQWFGGVKGESPDSRMGSLTWDETNFPNPAAKIAELRERCGVGVIPIEEPYICEGLPEFATLKQRGFLPTASPQGEPIRFSSWWGQGSLMDWTNPAAADYWHDLKRRPLIDAGIAGHWTDLGEPERFDPAALYYGFPDLGKHTHRDIHNLYNFRWAETIARGYTRGGLTKRPFILSRSGTSGIQRFGVGMWSGDIGSRLSHLAVHFNVQMHMSFSGIDYFGADIGGFHRWSLDGDLDELYTQWFADGAGLDVPVRPHTSNVDNKSQTAPDRIGHLPSNLANIRQRYELTPYLYSLAHRAWRYGEPVVPPLVFYHPDDPAVRQMASEKLLGRDLLVAPVAAYGQTTRDVYLPAGKWINYHTNERIESRGEWIRGLPLRVNGLFRLPVFARAGAILPLMHVDNKTMNVLGKRADGSRRDELIVRVFADEQPTEFTLYEDDGETTAYQQGAVRTTSIRQQFSAGRVTITIAGASGTYAGAPDRRDNVIELITPPRGEPSSVTLNGSPLTRRSSQVEFHSAADGWFNSGEGLIQAKSGVTLVANEKVFVVELSRG
jgi:alpha-glucosidase